MVAKSELQPITKEFIAKERKKFRNYGHLAGVAKANEILKDYDDKTGLLRHSKFIEEVEAIRESNKTRGLGALLIADIDNFKSLNDEFGHDVVDGRYLIPTANKVDSIARRETDAKSCRFAGEEFLLYLDGTDIHEAIRMAHLLRQDVNKLGIGLCVGVASFGPDSSYADVFNDADRALLVAKRTHDKNEVAAMDNGFIRIN